MNMQTSDAAVNEIVGKLIGRGSSGELPLPPATPGDGHDDMVSHLLDAHRRAHAAYCAAWDLYAKTHDEDLAFPDTIRESLIDELDRLEAAVDERWQRIVQHMPQTFAEVARIVTYTADHWKKYHPEFGDWLAFDLFEAWEKHQGGAA